MLNLADGVCKEVGIHLGRTNSDQTLSLLASLQASSFCPKPPSGLIVETIVNRDFCCVGGFSKQYTNCSNLAYKTTTSAPFYWLVLANIIIGASLIGGDNSDCLNEDTLYVVCVYVVPGLGLFSLWLGKLHHMQKQTCAFTYRFKTISYKQVCYYFGLSDK